MITRGAPRKKHSSQRGSMGTNMRHVHFKPGLMADREHVAYFGPLMRLEEVCRYRIYSALKQGYSTSRMTTNN